MTRRHRITLSDEGHKEMDVVKDLMLLEYKLHRKPTQEDVEKKGDLAERIKAAFGTLDKAYIAVVEECARVEYQPYKSSS